MKRARSLTLAAVVVVGLVLSACAPPPPVANSCAGTAVEPVIRTAFAGTGDEDWALRIAYRESHCIPENHNAHSDAAGLFQLLHHDDLIFAACPNPWGIVWWQDATCNATAARFLYNGSGRRAWGG